MLHPSLPLPSVFPVYMREAETKNDARRLPSPHLIPLTPFCLQSEMEWRRGRGERCRDSCAPFVIFIMSAKSEKSERVSVSRYYISWINRRKRRDTRAAKDVAERGGMVGPLGWRQDKVNYSQSQRSQSVDARIFMFI